MMNSNLCKEIQSHFALKSSEGAHEITSLNSENRAWSFSYYNKYGVFMQYDGDPVSEAFAGAEVHDQTVTLERFGTFRVIMLSCEDNSVRNSFATICEDFISPEKNRRTALKSPLTWWKNWKELLGNAQSEKMVYDIIAELMAVVKLYKENRKPYWTASKMNSHDIEMIDEEISYEVKSTINKSKSQIHISSQHQLLSDRDLYIVFTRLESSEQGKSIDELLVELAAYDKDVVSTYNKYLENKGLKFGNHQRKHDKYRVLERRLYKVDSSFPKITQKEFAGEKFPDNIVHIEYDINLDGLVYENWN